jgi:uncharacterized protein (DUF58 family)
LSALGPEPAELARAARILTLRSAREASGLFAGDYRSAFRGGGVEFEESRPYVPGDDVRDLDWNATARTGEPYVKRFREERDLLLLIGLDVSASMRFGSTGRAKAAVAAHAAALLAAAAGAARDRVGLVAFDEVVRAEVPPGRGPAHPWRVVREAVERAGAAGGGTSLAVAVQALRDHARHRAVVVLLSDFRGDSPERDPGARAALAALAGRHDVVALVVQDPRDEEIPSVGSVRLADPERPGRTLVLNTSSARARGAYRRAALRRRRSLERALRGAGCDLAWLRTDRDPLRELARFFRERARRRR